MSEQGPLMKRLVIPKALFVIGTSLICNNVTFVPKVPEALHKEITIKNFTQAENYSYAHN